MGWLFGSEWTQKKDIVNHLVSNFTGNYKVSEYSLRGNSLWLLVDVVDGDRKGQSFIQLCRLSKDDGIWGYKDMDDTCGPFFYDCPIKYIDKTLSSDRTFRDITLEWHKKVRAYHEKTKLKRDRVNSLTIGNVLNFGGKDYKLLEKLGRKGWLVLSIEDNCQFRMTAQQAGQASLLTL